MQWRYDDLLVRIAVADAYAMGTEYIRYERHSGVVRAALAFKGYVQHPTHVETLPGMYTDDTEMSVANANVLLASDGPYTKETFADAYVREFKYGGGRKGYSRGFQSLLESVDSGEELLARVRAGSKKNGAAMRAAVIGVLPTVAQVLEAATVQASVTHDTPEGRFSARMVALMAHGALYAEDLPLDMMATYCVMHLPRCDHGFLGEILERPWKGRVVGTKTRPVSLTTVHAVFRAVTTGTSLMDMLRMIIEWGGDTDSVAAITWGIASPRFRSEKLPEFMERDLEGGSPRTGAVRLRALGTALMDKYCTER